MNRSTILLVISSLISHLSSLSPAATQPIELPPFTFAGRIVDYAHVAYDSDTVVEVRVKTQDGKLLAKTKTATKGSTAFNYVVNVPLTDKLVAGYAQSGKAVVFEFVDPDGRIYSGLVTQGNATIGRPSEYRRVDVILATDADGDGVADEYLETLEYEMWRHGIAKYDADADYDGDGVNNRNEYIAGSNPFDATDKFSIRTMALADGMDDYVALKILVSQGRSYTLSTTGSLEKDVTEWVSTTFAVESPSASRQSALATGPSETGYRIIFVKKDGPSRFWRVNVE